MATAAADVARAILRHAADTNPCAVLSLAPDLPPVTPETPLADARRNYMRLAALVHPDKLAALGSGGSGGVEHATQTFQALVKMFELIANPTFRAGLLKAKATAAAAPKSAKPAAAKAPKPPKKAAKKLRRRKDSDSDSDDDDDDGDDDDDDDEDGATPLSQLPAAAAGKANVSRGPLRREGRSNDGCHRTIVGCPNCRSPWQPDDNRQHTLFMAFGLKIHCQRCLLLFGCATAIHACPGCSRTFDFDVSLFDSTIQCTNRACAHHKAPFGFTYYAVTQALVDAIAQGEREAAAKELKASEREARALARAKPGESAEAKAPSHGGSGGSGGGALSPEMDQLLGRVAMEGVCPLCKAKVKSKALVHLNECVAKRGAAPAAVPQPKRAPATVAAAAPIAAVALSTKPAAKPAPKAKKAPAKPAPKAKKAPARKRRRGSDDDDDDESEESSAPSARSSSCSSVYSVRAKYESSDSD